MTAVGVTGRRSLRTSVARPLRLTFRVTTQKRRSRSSAVAAAATVARRTAPSALDTCPATAIATLPAAAPVMARRAGIDRPMEVTEAGTLPASMPRLQPSQPKGPKTTAANIRGKREIEISRRPDSRIARRSASAASSAGIVSAQAGAVSWVSRQAAKPERQLRREHQRHRPVGGKSALAGRGIRHTRPSALRERQRGGGCWVEDSLVRVVDSCRRHLAGRGVPHEERPKDLVSQSEGCRHPGVSGIPLRGEIALAG